MKNDIEQKKFILELLYDAAAGINYLHDSDELLSRFVHVFQDLTMARAVIVRLLKDTNCLVFVTQSGFNDYIKDIEISTQIETSINGDKLSKGILLQTDINKCEKVARVAFASDSGITMISIPIHYNNNYLGVYNVFLDVLKSPLDEDTIDLFSSVGRHLGIALEKARLEKNIRRLTIMEERTLLANELHDSLAQTLASLRFQITMVEETVSQSKERTGILQIRQIKQSLVEANNQLRELLGHFRTKMDERGLIPAITGVIETFQRDTGITCFFQNTTQIDNLAPTLEVQILHIVQEALSNVRKHSQAQFVRILFKSPKKGYYTVLIEDDGIGMQSSEKNSKPGEHIGLSIMQQRANRISGTLLIESEAGEGTRIELNFQLPNEKPHHNVNR